MSRRHFRIEKTNHIDYFHIIIIFLAGAFVAIAALILPSLTADESLNLPFVAPRASLGFYTDKSVFETGEEFDLNVVLSVDRIVSGVDVYLSYDPKFLELEKVNPLNSKPADVYLNTDSSIFYYFPQGVFKQDGDKMIFAFSAVSEPLNGFRGRGEVASLRFKTLRAGDTSVDIVAEPGSTLDSNIAYEGGDILREAKGVIINIK